MTRADGRADDELRPITFTRNWQDHPAGSGLGEVGETKVLCGASVAPADAVAHLKAKGALAGEPLVASVAAVSVGIIDGIPRLDLPYEEDVRAETDMNVVMNGAGSFIEVQGTAEGAPFNRSELDALLALAEKGCADLTRLQHEALATPLG